MTTAAKKYYSLCNGEVWTTDKGCKIKIVSMDMTGGEFPLNAEYVEGDSSYTRLNFQGQTACGDQLVDMIPAAAPVAPVVDPYVEACIDDELALAPLLNWQNFCRPMKITPTVYLQGTHNKHHGHKVRNGSVFMPQWRRSWDGAGELIARCGMSIATSPAGVAVCAETGDTFRVEFRDHPSKDQAIRFAICKAAIAYLRAPP